MLDSCRRFFRRLAAAAAVVTYLLIIIGGAVRVTGSGLGCPDWPLCHGRLFPLPETAALIEFTHRSVAAVGSGLLIATLVAAWRCHRRTFHIVAPISAAVALLGVQVPLGALVVATELEPLAVAFHLGMGMLILAGVTLTAAGAHRPAHGLALSGRYQRLIGLALGAMFILLLTGALVVGSHAQLACPDWPLCHGALLPSPASSSLIVIHLIHRYTVVAVSALIVAILAATLHTAQRLRSAVIWAAVLGVLFGVQVGIGAAQVILKLPMAWRILHLAAATGVWAALVVLAGLVLPTQATSARR